MTWPSVTALVPRTEALARVAPRPDDAGVWNEPYLETCCRSALHRLTLSGAAGRPAGLKDGPCLIRLAGMDLARRRADGRYELTDAGVFRHARDILKRPMAAP
jgi:hypothetical protein